VMVEALGCGSAGPCAWAVCYRHVAHTMARFLWCGRHMLGCSHVRCCGCGVVCVLWGSASDGCAFAGTRRGMTAFMLAI
jgi:hypothetical protein